MNIRKDYETGRKRRSINPCLTCGACCAFYRVSFYWRECSDNKPDGVPISLCEDLNMFRRVMKGTNQSKPRCIALKGTIGKHVFCSIYWRKPSICCDIEPSYKYGFPESKCDKARLAYGLTPLTPGDWKAPEIDAPDFYSPAA
ncbi:MAG: YkgJ family cysteine cluster protein [Candidatus Hydrogenedens sp.]|nr:YkgJ family cysteine cluster protein [Candidatus Hydrogenedens sp.]